MRRKPVGFERNKENTVWNGAVPAVFFVYVF